MTDPATPPPPEPLREALEAWKIVRLIRASAFTFALAPSIIVIIGGTLGIAAVVWTWRWLYDGRSVEQAALETAKRWRCVFCRHEDR